MLPQYKMVLINFVLLCLLIVVFFIYKFFFHSKKNNYFLLLIICSLLPIVSIFRFGAYESGDFNLHIFRAIDFYKSLQEGILMPSWAAHLNANYGYPLFIFLNPLPYYMVAFFHFVGFSFVMSMKLFLSITYILSGVFMYIFVKKLLKNEKAALVAGIVYLYTPYHLIDMHFRVDVGEVALFMVLPLFFHTIVALSKKINLKNIFGMGLATALVVFSHQALAFFALLLAGFFVLYLAITSKSSRFDILVSSCSGVIIGLLISGYSLLPYILYSPYLQTGFGAKMYFANLFELLYTPYRYGLLYQGPRGELRFSLGYAQWILFGIGIFLLFIKRIEAYKLLIFSTLAMAVLIFAMLPISSPLWDLFPMIKIMVLTTRLQLFISLEIAVIAGIVVLNTKKQIFVYFLLFIIVISTILNWGQRRVIPDVNDQFLMQNMPFSSAGVEGWAIALSKWVSSHKFESTIPQKTFTIISGEGIVRDTSRTSNHHVYVIDAKNPITMIDNTWYFPGWYASIDNKQIPIVYSGGKYSGLIKVLLPEGKHILTISYEELKGLAFAKQVGFVSFLVVTSYLVFSHFAYLKRLKFYKFFEHQKK